MKELMYLKELTLISQINQRSVTIIGILKTLVINMDHIFALNVIICQW